MTIQKQPMWPTMFYVARFPDPDSIRKPLVNLCYSLRDSEAPWGIAARSKHNLYESPPKFLDHEVAQPLSVFFSAVVSTIFDRDPVFVESWCHITNDGGYHDAHAHIDFVRGICGIYYLQSGDCKLDPPNGVNRFYSPSLYDPNEVADILPEDGKLLLFPGNIRHAALPYTGKEDRIVISFNALFAPLEDSGKISGS